MKKAFYLIIFLTSIYSYSQNMRDVVYLKNGSIIKGTITEMNPSESLKIKTADGSLFVYSMNEILKTEKEEFVGDEVNQETTSVVSQSAINSFFSDYLSEKRPALKFIGASKKNGIKKEVFGQKVYEIEYELIIETKQDIYINASQFGSAWSNKFVDDFSYTLKGGSEWENTMAGEKKKIEGGKRIVANGTLNFEETDNGWRSKSFRNINFSTVSSDYVTPEMAEQKKENNMRLQQSYIKKGDWSSPDISNLELSPLYLSVDYVPLFNQSSVSLSVVKCMDCRNDNMKAIDESLKKVFNQVNRFNPSEKQEFTNNLNSYNIMAQIKNINFLHKGVQDNGDDKGFTCEINYNILFSGTLKDPVTLEYKDLKSDKSNSSALGFYPNKQSAFEGALLKFEKDIVTMLLKNQPYELKIVRLEINEKGKPENIILQKPNKFVDIDKGEFIIFKIGDLTVKDNKYSLKEIVGRCKFKGDLNENEIICEIKGNKNRKAFEKLESQLHIEYKAISNF
ncbi:hypothetical protein [Xanthomarina sp. F2636L]|uniref:hypothetical protein n=1 Tax=Xanthomarina sp. F2636L TaxID=2996018 RepID=UPI00225DDD5A|nr:hypothetical protein [Xanthomarina sp. F2636L]MCX7552124.1 hypothetical protein [Xanthomarina sp. F2636L]